MAQKIGDLYAEISILVNDSGLKDFQNKMKAVSAYIKTQIQETNLATAASKAQEAATKAKTTATRLETAEINKNAAAQRLQTLISREAEREANRQEKEERQRLKRRQRAYQEFAKTVRNTALGISGAIYGIIKFTQGTREKALEYRDFSRQTGLSVEGLQQYQAAASLSGSQMSGSDVAKEITGLQQRLVDIEYGRGDLFPFKMLNISAATRDALAVIEALREKIQGVPDPEALNLIEQTGLSADWLHILRLTREEFSKLNATMLSPQQVSGVARLAMSFRKAGFSLSNLKDQVSAFLSPVLDTFARSIANLADTFSSWLKTLYESPDAIRNVSMAVGLLITAISPLSALLLGIFLLIDDIMTKRRGGKSFFDWDLGAVKTGIDVVKKALEGVGFVIELIYRTIHSIGEDIGDIIAKITHPLEFIKSLLSAVGIKFGSDEPTVKPFNNGLPMTPVPTFNSQTMTPLPQSNNRITVNVGSPEEASRFVSDYSNNQSVLDTTYASVSSVGGY